MFCPYCGKEVSEGQPFCQHCGANLREQATTPTETPAEPTRTKTPWEDREHLGVFNALLNTLKQSLFNPSEFFRKMQLTGGVTDPLLYALIVGMVGLMFLYFWQVLFKGAGVDNLMPSGMAALAGQQSLHGGSLVLMAFLTPIFIIMGLFVLSGILHLFLMLVKGAAAGYEATFRVLAYSYSTNMIFILPICGSFIGAIWALVLTIIGLREAHQISGGKAALAVFLPCVLICGFLLFLVSVFFMGAVAASFGTMMNR